MLWVRKLMGWILVGMAAYFIRPILPETAGIFFLGGVALAAGLHLGWTDRTKASFRAFEWLKMSAGVVGLAAAAALARSHRGVLVLEQHAQIASEISVNSLSARGCSPNCSIHRSAV